MWDYGKGRNNVTDETSLGSKEKECQSQATPIREKTNKKTTKKERVIPFIRSIAGEEGGGVSRPTSCEKKNLIYRRINCYRIRRVLTSQRNAGRRGEGAIELKEKEKAPVGRFGLCLDVVKTANRKKNTV